MAIGADASISFSEICRTARDIEKRLITPTPNQISGDLHPPEAGSIFPKEYDEYTYLLLLSEAHKVERKLFASAYQGALTGTPASGQQGGVAAQQPKFDERQIENAAHQYSDYEISNSQTPKKEEQSAFSRFSGLKNPFGKSASEQIAPPSRQSQQATSAQAPVPREEQIPSEVLMARKERMARQELEAPPMPEKEEETAILSEEQDVPAPQKEAPVPIPALDEDAFETPELSKKQPVPGEEETLEAPSAPQQSGAAASQLSSSSKISPRLRAIIEEKLRREEEKERAEKAAEKAAEPLSAPAPLQEEEEKEAEKDGAGQEEKMDEAPAMSARERLLQKLKENRKTEAPVAPVAPVEKESPVEDELEREDRLFSERKVVPFSRSEKEEAQFEEHVEPKEVERVKPRVTPAEKPPLRTAAMPFQAKGGFQIKPIFSEDMGAKKEETADEEPTATFADKQVPVEKEAVEPKSPEEPVEASDDEESDVRMARIQRIIDELSPDKFKAQLDQPQKKKKLPEPEEDEGERAAEIEEDEKPVPKKTTEPEENEDSDEGEDGKNEKIKIPVSKIQQAKGKILPKLSSKEAKAAKGKAALAKQSPAKLPSSKKQLARVMPQALPVQKKTAPVQRKAAPAIAEEAPEKIAPVREEKPERVAPVQRRMPVREEEPEPEKEEAQAAIPVARVLPQKSSATSPSQSSGARPRIFPGGVKPPTPNTYITPVRTRALEKPPEETIDEAVEDNEETAAPVAKPVIVQKKMQPLVPKEPEEEPAEAKTQDETADEQEEKPAISKAIPIKKIPQPQTQGEKVLTSKPKKLVLEESVEETPSIEQLKERSHIKELGEKFVRMTSHDIAGEAKLPNDKDESESDLEVPKPPRADAPPKPADYAQAKENLRHKEQQEEIVEGAKKENEEMLESYAKDNLTWLYEIYKMGGIAREAFLQKVQEKIDEERGAGEIEKMEVDPDNPALAALGKELGEKKKKWPF